MSQRLARLEELLLREFANLLQREVRDPRLRNVVPTRVELSPDFRHAKVFVSVLNEEMQRQEAIRALERAEGFLRRELAHRLNLRVTPELQFLLDRGAEHSQRIATILEELQRQSRSDREGGETQ